MREFREVVESYARATLETELQFQKVISHDIHNVCIIVFDSFCARVYYDRSGFVSSSFVFPDSGDYIEIATHIGLKRFDVECEKGKETGKNIYQNIEQNTPIELQNIKQFAIMFYAKNITVDQLNNFQMGYESAYTDYCSGKW